MPNLALWGASNTWGAVKDPLPNVSYAERLHQLLPGYTVITRGAPGSGTYNWRPDSFNFETDYRGQRYPDESVPPAGSSKEVQLWEEFAKPSTAGPDTTVFPLLYLADAFRDHPLVVQLNQWLNPDGPMYPALEPNVYGGYYRRIVQGALDLGAKVIVPMSGTPWAPHLYDGGGPLVKDRLDGYDKELWHTLVMYRDHPRVLEGPDLRVALSEESYWSGDPFHPNQAGHDLIADLLVQHL